LTAWSAAGVLGPLLINYIREYQIAHGVPKAQAYDVTMYVLAALVLVGILLNTMIRPLADRHFMTDAELAAEKKLAHERDVNASSGGRVGGGGGAVASSPLVTAFAWLAVGIPLMFGVWVTLQKASVLFK
jgi:hypothetical protein